LGEYFRRWPIFHSFIVLSTETGQRTMRMGTIQERNDPSLPFADNNILLPPYDRQNFIWLILASISKLFRKSNSGSWLWY
jgi:hypothetical protein